MGRWLEGGYNTTAPCSDGACPHRTACGSSKRRPPFDLHSTAEETEAHVGSRGDSRRPTRLPAPAQRPAHQPCAVTHQPGRQWGHHALPPESQEWDTGSLWPSASSQPEVKPLPCQENCGCHGLLISCCCRAWGAEEGTQPAQVEGQRGRGTCPVGPCLSTVLSRPLNGQLPHGGASPSQNCSTFQ